MPKKSGFDHIREEAEAEQRGILWPDMLRQGREVDEFLWKGDLRAPLVQRIGLVLFGIMFLSCAIISIVLVFAQNIGVIRIVCAIVAMLFGVAGMRFLINAFKHETKHRKSK